MKKRIAFVLLCSLLLLSLPGCVLPEPQNEGTTPETTTPEVTTPEGTTPGDNPVVTPPEENLVNELFGDKTMEFTAELLTVRTGFSNWSDFHFVVKDGNLYFGNENNLCTISRVDTITISFAGEDEYDWFGTEPENVVELFEKITNSDEFYILSLEVEHLGMNEIIMCKFNETFYFMNRNPSSGTVRKLYSYVMSQTTPTPEQNLVTELFGDEPVTIIAPVITMWVGLSSADPLYISVENGEIHLLGHTYSLSYDENAGLTYPEDSFLTWFGEKDEKLAEVYEKIQNTTDFYHLEADTGNDGYAYESIHFCMIDGVYYFITHSGNSKRMFRLHYGIFE